VDKLARIFVSSTFKDLEECSEKVRTALRRMGHECIACKTLLPRTKYLLTSVWKMLLLVISTSVFLLGDMVMCLKETINPLQNLSIVKQ
jgi:hypothetical protein